MEGREDGRRVKEGREREGWEMERKESRKEERGGRGEAIEKILFPTQEVDYWFSNVVFTFDLGTF